MNRKLIGISYSCLKHDANNNEIVSKQVCSTYRLMFILEKHGCTLRAMHKRFHAESDHRKQPAHAALDRDSILQSQCRHTAPDTEKYNAMQVGT